MTYHNAVKYITTAPTKTGVNESLERTKLLCKHLGSPEKKLKYIRFAGSNGKTVCQTMLTSVLFESGFKVGSLLMPAHTDPRENITVNKEILSMEDTVKYVSMIASAVNELRSEIEALKNSAEENDATTDNPFIASVIAEKTNIMPTKNEIIFLVSLLAFKDKGCDICLIESDHNGVDPTKILTPPRLAVICGTIPPENTKELTRIRSYLTPGILEVISAPQDRETRNCISSSCARINCRLSVPTKHEVTRLSLGGSEFIYGGEKYKLSICGRFQIQNAATVIEAVTSLRRLRYTIPHEALVKGLSAVSLSSKFETISVSPTIIIDSTHKVEAVGTMCNTLADFKDQIGDTISLCICPDAPLILEYVSVLNSLGFTVSELIIPLGDKKSSFEGLELEVSCPVNILTTPKATAKQIIESSKAGGFVLVTAPDTLADKLRTEIYRILGF